MIVKASIKIGSSTYWFEVEEKNEMETLNKVITLTNPPTYCNYCNKTDTLDNFHLTTNKDKENNIYVNIKHNVCGGKAKLGQFKAGGFFWHRQFEVYKGKKQEEQDQGEEQPA